MQGSVVVIPAGAAMGGMVGAMIGSTEAVVRGSTAAEGTLAGRYRT